MATRARGRFFLTPATEWSASTISGSIRLRDLCAFLIQRGGMFALNFKNARAAEPELDTKSFASLGIPHLPRRYGVPGEILYPALFSQQNSRHPRHRSTFSRTKTKKS